MAWTTASGLLIGVAGAGWTWGTDKSWFAFSSAPYTVRPVGVYSQNTTITIQRKFLLDYQQQFEVWVMHGFKWWPTELSKLSKLPRLGPGPWLIWGVEKNLLRYWLWLADRGPNCCWGWLGARKELVPSGLWTSAPLGSRRWNVHNNIACLPFHRLKLVSKKLRFNRLKRTNFKCFTWVGACFSFSIWAILCSRFLMYFKIWSTNEKRTNLKTGTSTSLERHCETVQP